MFDFSAQIMREPIYPDRDGLFLTLAYLPNTTKMKDDQTKFLSFEPLESDTSTLCSILLLLRGVWPGYNKH